MISLKLIQMGPLKKLYAPDHGSLDGKIKWTGVFCINFCCAVHQYQLSQTEQAVQTP